MPPVSIGLGFLIIVKYFIITFLVLYVIFALVVVRQVHLMTQTLDVGFETPIKLLSFIHLALAVAVILFAIGAL